MVVDSAPGIASDSGSVKDVAFGSGSVTGLLQALTCMRQVAGTSMQQGVGTGVQEGVGTGM